MENYKILSLDGSGLPSYKHDSTEYCLSAFIIDKKIKDKIERQLIKVKKKIFKDEELVLHYREIARKSNKFAILKNKASEDQFWSDIISIINNPESYCVFEIVDKNNAKKSGWQEKTIVEKCCRELLKNFAVILKGQKSKGRIIAESDKFQDEFLIRAHNFYQSDGIPSLKISNKEYNNMITSLCLVNKNNFDPEIQLADLLGSTARLKYRIEKLKSREKISKVELKKLKLIDRKIKNNSAKIDILK